MCSRGEMSLAKIAVAEGGEREGSGMRTPSERDAERRRRLSAEGRGLFTRVGGGNCSTFNLSASKNNLAALSTAH